MSYILDALRRAEAERGRGAVPGVHSQAMSAPRADSSGSGHWLLWGGAVVAVAGLAAGGTWWAMQRSAPAVGPAVAAPPAAMPGPAAVPSAAPVSVAAAPAVAVVPPPAPVPAPDTRPLLPPTPVTLEPRPVAPKRVADPAREKPAAAPAPAPAVARVRETPAPPPAPTARAQPPAPTAPPAVAPAAAAQPGAAPPNGPVFAQNDLPPSVREQLPALTVTGATYSSNPAHRMAIVNGQVLQEGDQAAPGLKLERIEQSRTVWSFHGYRYAVRLQ